MLVKILYWLLCIANVQIDISLPAKKINFFAYQFPSRVSTVWLNWLNGPSFSSLPVSYFHIFISVRQLFVWMTRHFSSPTVLFRKLFHFRNVILGWNGPSIFYIWYHFFPKFSVLETGPLVFFRCPTNFYNENG